jgi:hypothetical protein
VYVKIDIGKTVEHNKNYVLVTQYYLLYNATSFDPTVGSSSGKEKNWGHENVHALPHKLKKEGKNQN